MVTEVSPTVTVASGVGLSQADRTRSPGGHGTERRRRCDGRLRGEERNGHGPKVIGRPAPPRGGAACRDAGARRGQATRGRGRRAGPRQQTPYGGSQPGARIAAATRHAQCAVERQRDADAAADHPGHLQQRLGAGERGRPDLLRHVALDQRVQRQLGQSLGEARRPRRARRPSARRRRPRRVTATPSASPSTVAMITSGPRVRSQAPTAVPSALPDARRDTDDAERDRRALPGQRMLAQQERQEEDQEAGEAAQATAFAGERVQDGRRRRSAARGACGGLLQVRPVQMLPRPRPAAPCPRPSPSRPCAAA